MVAKAAVKVSQDCLQHDLLLSSVTRFLGSFMADSFHVSIVRSFACPCNLLRPHSSMNPDMNCVPFKVDNPSAIPFCMLLLQ